MYYLAITGLRGCLPTACDPYETKENAVESMALLYELGRRRKRTLKRDMFLDLNLYRDGNEYIEITEVEGIMPEGEM